MFSSITMGSSNMYIRTLNPWNFLIDWSFFRSISTDYVFSINSKPYHSTVEFVFRSLCKTNSFVVLDSDAHIAFKINFSGDHSFETKAMSIQEMKNLHEICEPERTLLSTINAILLQNTQFAAFLLAGDWSYWKLFAQGSSVLRYDSPRFLSPWLETEKFSQITPYHCRNAVVHIDLRNKRNFQLRHVYLLRHILNVAVDGLKVNFCVVLLYSFLHASKTRNLKKSDSHVPIWHTDAQFSNNRFCNFCERFFLNF